jgi:hypothetical protein
MQRLHAGGDDDFCALETARNHDRFRIEALHLDIVQGDGLGLGIDDPDGGLAFDLGEGARRNRDTRAGVQFQTPGHGRAKPHRLGVVDQTHPHPERARDRVGLRIDRAYARLRGHGRIVCQGHGDRGVRRRGSQHLGRHVEHGVAAILARDLIDRLPGLHHFARLGVPCADRASYGRLQLVKLTLSWA